MAEQALVAMTEMYFSKKKEHDFVEDMFAKLRAELNRWRTNCHENHVDKSSQGAQNLSHDVEKLREQLQQVHASRESLKTDNANLAKTNEDYKRHAFRQIEELKAHLRSAQTYSNNMTVANQDLHKTKTSLDTRLASMNKCLANALKSRDEAVAGIKSVNDKLKAWTLTSKSGDTEQLQTCTEALKKAVEQLSNTHTSYLEHVRQHEGAVAGGGGGAASEQQSVDTDTGVSNGADASSEPTSPESMRKRIAAQTLRIQLLTTMCRKHRDSLQKANRRCEELEAGRGEEAGGAVPSERSLRVALAKKTAREEELKRMMNVKHTKMEDALKRCKQLEEEVTANKAKINELTSVCNENYHEWKLENERCVALEKAGAGLTLEMAIWKPSYDVSKRPTWDQMYERYKQYCQQHVHNGGRRRCVLPSFESGIKDLPRCWQLGTWYSAQLNAYRNDNLTDERRERMYAMNEHFRTRKDTAKPAEAQEPADVRDESSDESSEEGSGTIDEE
jgi:chromosome segregation ATPase